MELFEHAIFNIISFDRTCPPKLYAALMQLFNNEPPVAEMIAMTDSEMNKLRYYYNSVSDTICTVPAPQLSLFYRLHSMGHHYYQQKGFQDFDWFEVARECLDTYCSLHPGEISYPANPCDIPAISNEDPALFNYVTLNIMGCDREHCFQLNAALTKLFGNAPTVAKLLDMTDSQINSLSVQDALIGRMHQCCAFAAYRIEQRVHSIDSDWYQVTKDDFDEYRLGTDWY